MDGYECLDELVGALMFIGFAGLCFLLGVLALIAW